MDTAYEEELELVRCEGLSCFASESMMLRVNWHKEGRWAFGI